MVGWRDFSLFSQRHANMFSKITSLFKSKKPESTPDHLPVEAAEQPLPFAAPAPNEVKQDPPAVDADAFTPASIQPEQPPAEVQDTLKVEFTAEFTSPVEFVSEHPIEPALDSSQNTPPIFEATPSFIPEQSVEAPQQQEQPAPPVNSRENTVTHQAPPEPAPSAAQSEPVKQEKLGFFARIKQGLARTTSQFAEGVGNLFLGKKAIDDELLEDLETQLLVADVGIEATTVIIDDLTGRVARKQLNDSDALFAALQENLRNLLLPVEKPLVIPAEFKPFVILVVGVNGAGKTTTIGKLAHRFLAEGKSVMLAAGDTFRAAAVEQLQVWGERNKVPVIAQHTGADSASVIFDALNAAKARGVDVLIADTAGRLHNKSHLMEELIKVKRVLAKIDPSAPHETLLVLDAGTGQNAVNQCDQFHQSVGVTGLALTKLDGTAKGGIIFALSQKHKIPVRYIGVGETLEDLQPFAARPFVDALFGKNSPQ